MKLLRQLGESCGIAFRMRLLFLFFSLLSSLVWLHAENLWTDRGYYSISWYNSTQTEFEISTAEEFAGIAYLQNEGYTNFQGKTIILKEDIDLKGRNWIPIGNNLNPFKGKMNGEGHKISGMNVVFRTDSKYSEYYGLFGATYNAKVSNFILSGNINIVIENYHPTQIVGSCCGYAEKSDFENIESNVDVRYNRDNTSAHKYKIYVGGFIGEIFDCELTDIHYCGDYFVYIGPTQAQGSFLQYSEFKLGGLFAAGEYSEIKYCTVIATADIDLGSSNNVSYNPTLEFGGISGYPIYSEITSCWVVLNKVDLKPPYSASKAGSLEFGGICGWPPTSRPTDPGSVENCYAVVLDARMTLVNGNIRYGGILGFDYNATTNVPYRYIFNHSNKDFVMTNTAENISSASTFPGFNGNTYFTADEMKTQAFVDELNLYYTLNGRDPHWYYVEGDYPHISIDPIKQSGIDEIFSDSHIFDIYDFNGIMIKKDSNREYLKMLKPGVYILRRGTDTWKFIIR